MASSPPPFIHIHLAILAFAIGCDDVAGPNGEPHPVALADDALASPLDPSATAFPVLNPGFELPWFVPVGEPATTLAECTFPPGAFGASASKSWTTYANTPATSINSWILDAPTYPVGGPTAPSILVAVGGTQDGIVQVLADQDVVTDVNLVSAWVYVVAGRAALQIGNGGSGGGSVAVSTTTGGWEQLVACGRPDLLNNEITVYGDGPAVFYVDDVDTKFSDGCP